MYLNQLYWFYDMYFIFLPVGGNSPHCEGAIHWTKDLGGCTEQLPSVWTTGSNKGEMRIKSDRQKLNPNNSSACNAVSLEIIEGEKNLKIFILMEFGWSYFGEVLHSDEIRNS